MAFLQEYTMLDELGKGGFATVYKVRHNELGYIRAMRVLNETIAVKKGQKPENNDTFKKFKRECVTLLRLGNGNHSNIVHIYQPRLLENKALVEMDYVDGMDISKFLKQEQNFVAIEDVIRMATQMSSALAYCHEDIYRFCMDRDLDNLEDDPNDGSKVLLDEPTRDRLITKYKVIHNDIHSGNIMRREDGNFVLLDFGLAINGDEIVRSSRHTNGAPEYKAPEKWDNESILTEQSDIYSFGIVLFQYLAGRVPFPFNKHISSYKAEFELGEAHQKASLPSIEVLRKESFEQKYEGQEYKKDYPQWLEDAIIRCLQKRPEDRFRNGKELNNFIIEHTNEMKNAPGELLKDIEKLNKKNEELSSEVISLREKNQSLNEVLNEKQKALIKMEDALKDAEVNAQKSKEECVRLELKNEQLSDKISSLENDLKVLEDETDSLSKKNQLGKSISSTQSHSTMESELEEVHLSEDENNSSSDKNREIEIPSRCKDEKQTSFSIPQKHLKGESSQVSLEEVLLRAIKIGDIIFEDGTSSDNIKTNRNPIGVLFSYDGNMHGQLFSAKKHKKSISINGVQLKWHEASVAEWVQIIQNIGHCKVHYSSGEYRYYSDDVHNMLAKYKVKDIQYVTSKSITGLAYIVNTESCRLTPTNERTTFSNIYVSEF